MNLLIKIKDGKKPFNVVYLIYLKRVYFSHKREGFKKNRIKICRITTDML